MPVRYILSSVWVRSSIFSQLSIIQYMGLCVFSLPISLVMIERICCLVFIIKSEVWTIIHCLGLGHETKVCAVCLSICLAIFEVSSGNTGVRYISYYVLIGLVQPCRHHVETNGEVQWETIGIIFTDLYWSNHENQGILKPEKFAGTHRTTHCGLVTPYRDIDLGQHWLM